MYILKFILKESNLHFQVKVAIKLRKEILFGLLLLVWPQPKECHQRKGQTLPDNSLKLKLLSSCCNKGGWFYLSNILFKYLILSFPNIFPRGIKLPVAKERRKLELVSLNGELG